MNDESSIKLRGLVKRFGERTVVNGVSAEVGTGEVVGLLGPNGAGKTTTFYIVVGLVKPDRGTVTLDLGDREIDLTSAPMYARARNGVGYLAQENSIFRKLSVGDNIRLIWEQNGVPRDEQERRLPALLEEFGLRAFVERARRQPFGRRAQARRDRARARNSAALSPPGRAVHGHRSDRGRRYPNDDPPAARSRPRDFDYRSSSSRNARDRRSRLHHEQRADRSFRGRPRK